MTTTVALKTDPFGFGPLPVLRPGSVAELGDIVRRTAVERQAVYPVGGSTMLHVGLPPTQPGVVVDLRKLDQVIDYPARDMTITVQAGITLAKLQTILAVEQQRLPIDVPDPEHATLGGALAVNVSGPRRYGFGTLRDYVLGISVVNDEGQETKAGGRVVKNVAGYDLMKLHIGALGTLGVITQVTLKLKPVPEEQALLAIPCGRGMLDDLLNQIHASRTRPVCISVRSNRTNSYDLKSDQQGAWTVFVGYEDNREAVAWQRQQLEDELRHRGVVAENHDDTAWNELTSFLLDPSATLTVKANVLPWMTAQFCEQFRLPHSEGVVAHAGNGIVMGHVMDDLTLDEAQGMLTRMQDKAAPGNVVVLRCPWEWKQKLPVWGKPRGDGWLMKAVKEKMDPRRIFNPGRFVEGI